MLLASGAILFPVIGQAPFERAEIYFMDGARAMVESGDYLVPHYRGEPFFDKPPLTYWLMAASFRLFGFTPAAARVVPAAAALLVILATIWLGTLLVGRAAALAGGVCLTTTGAFMAFGRVAMSDMILALWTTLAMALAIVILRGAPALWPTAALGAVLGLGFLTKGPVALLLPGLGIGWLFWRTPPPRPRVPRRALLVAAVAFIALGLGWFAAVFLRLGPAPLAHFFLRENLARFAGETYDAGRAPWYYLVTYLALGAPWSAFLPLAAWRAVRGGDADPGSRLLLVWMGLMAIPLSLSRGKIDYYLLPLYPAGALVVGRYFSAVQWRSLDLWWSRVALLLATAGLAMVTVMVAGLPAGWLPGPWSIRLLFALVLVGSLAAALGALRASPGRVLGVLAAMAFALFLVFTILFLPPFRAAQPNLALVTDVLRERRYRPDARLALCADPARVQRDLLFFGRLTAQEHCDLWAPATSAHPFLILASRDESASLANVPAIRDVGEYAYLPATALTLRGLLAGPRPDTLRLLANYATTDPVAEAKWKRDRRKALKAAFESRP